MQPKPARRTRETWKRLSKTIKRVRECQRVDLYIFLYICVCLCAEEAVRNYRRVRVWERVRDYLYVWVCLCEWV